MRKEEDRKVNRPLEQFYDTGQASSQVPCIPAKHRREDNSTGLKQRWTEVMFVNRKHERNALHTTCKSI